ncbi:FAD-binding and (Fe-S)-binding domain-containing protein [soil metagenome]
MNRTDTSARAGTASTDERALGASILAALGRDAEVATSAFGRVVAAVDASHYLLTPRAIVTPRSADEVAALFAFATAGGETLTFRSGGTSLSGQGVTGGILVDTRSHFRAIEVLDGGARVRVQPGITVRQVNARLARHKRKLGPDPASEIACTIGGVIANNSSGMACGIADNSYRTLESAVIVLPGGTVVDTADPEADEKLRMAEPLLWESLGRMRDRITGDPELLRTVTAQYLIKNTMGYGMNSFVDFESPAEILAHLMIGSEGTLGFVAGATFRTIAVQPSVATALLVFDTLDAATAALVDLVATGAATIELMDAASLRVSQADPESARVLPRIDIAGHAALLVEYQAADAELLTTLTAAADALFSALPTTTPAVFTSDAGIRAALWHIRKGLFAAVAGARPSGTTALLEDIAVPVPRLAATCAGLRELFARHGYVDAVIFGHAKDGNVHFLINEDFDDEANLVRYREFTEDMVDLVLSAGGTLKAEHGTGRIMAPYVRRQFGDELYEIMREVKRLVDPAGILSPDIVITTDPDLHVRHLKSTPTVEVEVDRCVECGYCEPVCPSKDLTTTPRQRIAVRRAIADAQARGDKALVKELEAAQGYQVVDTCAVDGMCATACPVFINTGDLVRRLRSETVGFVETAVWNTAAEHWKPVTAAASLALSVASSVPAPLVEIPNRVARAIVGPDLLPLWAPDLPRGGAARASGMTQGAGEVVYFAACVGTMFGPAAGGTGVAASLESLMIKAGIGVIRPERIGELCCGTPWKSKGVLDGYHSMVDRTVQALWAASREGELPVVCDNSSCSEGLVHALEDAARRGNLVGLTIVDAVDFAADELLPRLQVDATLERIVVHPTCSSTRAGSNDNLMTIAGAVAGSATVPDDWGCCAFAGDRGMLHPELTASATGPEAAAVELAHYDAYASCNRTCEIGMTRATGHEYQHILELLDEASQSKEQGREQP